MTRTQKKFNNKSISASSAYLTKARKSALKQAQYLHAEGQTSTATELLRRLTIELGPHSDIYFEYGQIALESGQSWAAREAFHNAVDLDPSNLDALELFLDLNHELPAVKGSATRAIIKLASLVPKNDQFDADATAFLVPSANTVEAVGTSVRKLRNSSNEVAREVSHLTTSSPGAWRSDDRPISSETQTTAQLIVSLVTGNYDTSLPLLEDSDLILIPKRALRIAARREVRRANTSRARELLMYYERIAPSDIWSRYAIRHLDSNSR